MRDVVVDITVITHTHTGKEHSTGWTQLTLMTSFSSSFLRFLILKCGAFDFIAVVFLGSQAALAKFITSRLQRFGWMERGRYTCADMYGFNLLMETSRTLKRWTHKQYKGLS